MTTAENQNIGRRPYVPEDGECKNGCGPKLQDGQDQAGRSIKVCSSCSKEYALRKPEEKSAVRAAPLTSAAAPIAPPGARSAARASTRNRATPRESRGGEPCTAVKGCPGVLDADGGCPCCEKRAAYVDERKPVCNICRGKFTPTVDPDHCAACAPIAEAYEQLPVRAAYEQLPVRAERRGGRRPGPKSGTTHRRGRPPGATKTGKRGRKVKVTGTNAHTRAIVAKLRRAHKRG